MPETEQKECVVEWVRSAFKAGFEIGRETGENSQSNYERGLGWFSMKKIENIRDEALNDFLKELNL